MSNTAGAIQREDIRLRTRGDQPVLEIGEVEIVLRTHFEGAPPEEVDIDHHGDGAYYVMDFDEEYFGGLLEIAPEYIPPGGEEDE